VAYLLLVSLSCSQPFLFLSLSQPYLGRSLRRRGSISALDVAARSPSESAVWKAYRCGGEGKAAQIKPQDQLSPLSYRDWAIHIGANTVVFAYLISRSSEPLVAPMPSSTL